MQQANAIGSARLALPAALSTHMIRTSETLN